MRLHYTPFLLLLLLSIGCNLADRFSGGQKNVPAMNSPSNTSANSTKPSANVNKDVLSAFENLKTQTYVTAKVDNEGPDTKYDELIEAAGIAKVRRTFVYVPGFQKTPSDSSEEIQIGIDVFVKQASGDWVKAGYKTNDSTVFNNMIPLNLPEIDFVPAGDENIDGKPVSVYNMGFSSPEAAKGMTGKVWLRKDKQVPLKLRFDRPNGTSTTYSYDLDTPIKPIEAPKGVK
jgi:hypothetical protein